MEPVQENFEPSLIPDVGCMLDISIWTFKPTPGSRVNAKSSWMTVTVVQVIPPFTKDIKVCGSYLRGSKYWRLEVAERNGKTHLVRLDVQFEFRRPQHVDAPSPQWRFL